MGMLCCHGSERPLQGRLFADVGPTLEPPDLSFELSQNFRTRASNLKHSDAVPCLPAPSTPRNDTHSASSELLVLSVPPAKSSLCDSKDGASLRPVAPVPGPRLAHESENPVGR